MSCGVIVRPVSDTTFPRRTKFGDKVRGELDRQRISVRKLAKTLDPQRPEVARRNLARWIGGYNSPSRLNRIAVAEALGVPAEAFLEEDDEEADPLVDLMRALRRVVREEMARELA